MQSRFLLAKWRTLKCALLYNGEDAMQTTTWQKNRDNNQQEQHDKGRTATMCHPHVLSFRIGCNACKTRAVWESCSNRSKYGLARWLTYVYVFICILWTMYLIVDMLGDKYVGCQNQQWNPMVRLIFHITVKACTFQFTFIKKLFTCEASHIRLTIFPSDHYIPALSSNDIHWAC